MDTKKLYTPIIKKLNLGGICAKTVLSGETAPIIIKATITSLNDIFPTIMKQLLNITIGISEINYINNLLILIKPDNTAYIYKHFPLGVKARLKRSVTKGSIVYNDDIADIESIFFEDAIFKFNYERGDKVICLLRENWKFVLHIDLTCKSNKEEVYFDIGNAYKLLKYYDLYKFLENHDNFDMLINDGWFPFIELMSSTYKDLLNYYNNKENYLRNIDFILNKYTPRTLNILIQKWWSNPIFSDKKEIIEAGIDSYCSNTKSGYINCIKNLSTELEGIIRITYTDKNHKTPQTKDLKNFIYTVSKAKFSSDTSLAFPLLFKKYLDNVIFKGFDIIHDNVPPSRHSFAHGVASTEQYSKIKAFQLILCLDQLYYYLL